MSTNVRAETMPAAPGGGLQRLGRFGPLFFIAQLGWAIPGATSSTLLQALSAQIQPSDKLALYATIQTVGAVLATVSMIVAGALSDRTRSRFGQRKPWIIGGAIVAAVGLATAGLTHVPGLVIISYALYQVGLNAMLGSIFALMPDYLSGAVLGKASALSGVGNLVGQVIGGVVAAIFVTQPSTGLLIIPWTMVVVAVLLGIFIPKRPNLDVPRNPLSWQEVLRVVRPPKDGQFWWTFAGRFFFILALNMTLLYQLFIATDYLHLSTQDSGNLLGVAILIYAAGAGVCAVIAGFLSDKVRRRKPFVIGASILTAVGVIPLLSNPDPWALLLYYGLAGCAFGAYISVDQALMVEVLPDQSSPARDLGFLNAANSLPTVFAPLTAAALVAIVGFSGMFITSIVFALIGAGCIIGVRRVR